MSEDIFESSDSVRSGSRLKHVKTVLLDKPLKLERDGELPCVTVAYETYGRLNSARDNAVLVCHALSGDSHVASHDEHDDPGWWELAIGPGKAIDTEKYFVICPNILGGCRGTTGPNSIDPATGKPYGPDFPTITIGDMVEVHCRMIDKLGIDRLLAAVGASMGGHQVLCMASRYPSRLAGAIPIATSPRVSSQTLAFDIVGRNAIMQDPNFHDGRYYDKDTTPAVGLAIARMIGHITYLSRESMQQKFEDNRHTPRDVPVAFEKKFSVGSYLGYQGARFVERFDANSYIKLTMAMDVFDLGHTRKTLSAALSKSTCRWLAMSFTSDWLFSPGESQAIVDALVANDKPVSYCNIKSDCGHDAFLLANELDSYGALIEAFLANLRGDAAGRGCCEHSPTSIFNPDHPQRLDCDRIVDLIGDSSSVLDLGCGNGELLSRLGRNSSRRTVGVEIDQGRIIGCVRRGLDVIHADLNEGLARFSDNQFDCVVLSRTLQSVRDVERVVDDMLRVGKRCIVSFPNFAYRKLREMLCEQGRTPESPGQLKHKWYNTPNIRFLTIADFEAFCLEKKIKVHQRVCLDTEGGNEITDQPNLNADLAIYVISR